MLSPDCSGNPFAFFFKKQKIETESGNRLQSIRQTQNDKFGFKRFLFVKSWYDILSDLLK